MMIFFLKLMCTKCPLILDEDFSTGKYAENKFFILKTYKEKTILKKLSNVEFDDKEWNEFKKGFIELAKLYTDFNFRIKRLRKIYPHHEDRKKELIELGLEDFIVNGTFTLPTEDLFKYDFILNKSLNTIKEFIMFNNEFLKKIENFQ